jgi:hypothetical protein
MTNTECPLYNKGLYIEKINQTDAHVSMCCMQIMSPEFYTNINFHTNDYLEKIRNTDAKIPACVSCFENERIGNQSYRQGQAAAFAQQGIEQNNTVELKSFSYNCENVCNLKCITCGPKYSSLWYSEYKKLNYKIEQIKSSGKHNRIFESLDLSQVELVHFQGGEPLLTQDHELIIKKIFQQGNINNLIASYNTNATVFPNDNVIDLWKKTKMTKLFFSIDGTGDQFEYIRFPGVWDQVNQNMKNIRDLNFPGLWIEIGLTVGINNLFYLQDIIDWRDREFSQLHNGDPINIFINFVNHKLGRGGKVLGLHNLNDRIKSAAIEYLDLLTDKNIAASVKGTILSQQSNDNNDWVQYLNDIDRLRGTNWQHSLSKLTKYI